MRTEAQIRQCIDWLHNAVSIHDPNDEEGRFIIGSIRGQIDILLWTLGEPNNWDKVYAEMVYRHVISQN